MFKYNIIFNNLSNYFKINYFFSLNINYFYNTYCTYKNLLQRNIILKNFLIFFFKKEFYYTKLKYSRVPQVDKASGGIACLLAGLLGMLITERFGFELLDSGDFYFLVMMLIFILLILRILFKKILLVLSLQQVATIYTSIFIFFKNNFLDLYNLIYLNYIKVRTFFWVKSNKNRSNLK